MLLELYKSSFNNPGCPEDPENSSFPFTLEHLHLGWNQECHIGRGWLLHFFFFFVINIAFLKKRKYKTLQMFLLVVFTCVTSLNTFLSYFIPPYEQTSHMCHTWFASTLEARWESGQILSGSTTCYAEFKRMLFISACSSVFGAKSVLCGWAEKKNLENKWEHVWIEYLAICPWYRTIFLWQLLSV